MTMNLENLPSVSAAFQALKKLPGLTYKNIYKIIMHLAEADNQSCIALSSTILSMKKNLKKCGQCCAWTENSSGVCSVCQDQTRDKKIVCVVETWVDYLFFCEMEFFNGSFHVLGGKISPLDGLTPEALSINSLLSRIETQGVTEIIFALSMTPEGEVTTNYICKQLEKLGENKPKCSRLASGIPFGATLEYLDQQTLDRAFSGRQTIL